MTLRIQIGKFDSLRKLNALVGHLSPDFDSRFVHIKNTKIVFAGSAPFTQSHKRIGNKLLPITTHDEVVEADNILEDIEMEVESRKIGKEARKKGIVSRSTIAEMEQKAIDKEINKIYAVCFSPAGVSLFQLIYNRYGSFFYCFDGFDDIDMKRFSPRRRIHLAEIKPGVEITPLECMEVYG